MQVITRREPLKTMLQGEFAFKGSPKNAPRERSTGEEKRDHSRNSHQPLGLWKRSTENCRNQEDALAHGGKKRFMQPGKDEKVNGQPIPANHPGTKRSTLQLELDGGSVKERKFGGHVRQELSFQ